MEVSLLNSLGVGFHPWCMESFICMCIYNGVRTPQSCALHQPVLFLFGEVFTNSCWTPEVSVHSLLFFLLRWMQSNENWIKHVIYSLLILFVFFSSVKHFQLHQIHSRCHKTTNSFSFIKNARYFSAHLDVSDITKLCFSGIYQQI